MEPSPSANSNEAACRAEHAVTDAMAQARCLRRRHCLGEVSSFEDEIADVTRKAIKHLYCCFCVKELEGLSFKLLVATNQALTTNHQHLAQKTNRTNQSTLQCHSFCFPVALDIFTAHRHNPPVLECPAKTLVCAKTQTGSRCHSDAAPATVTLVKALIRHCPQKMGRRAPVAFSPPVSPETGSSSYGQRGGRSFRSMRLPSWSVQSSCWHFPNDCLRGCRQH